MNEIPERVRVDLDRAIDADRDAMRGLLAALVSTPTENPPATRYLPCVRLIESALQALDIDYERVEIPSPPNAPRAAIVAWVGPPGPTLYLHGHYDVVPAQSPDQFTPHVDGDTLF